MTRVLLAATATLALAMSGTAQADVIGGVEFPQGAISFADAVVDYVVGGGGVTEPHQGAFNALGLPDFADTDPDECAAQIGCHYASLGVGGVLTLRFTDNVLTGSDSSAFDLWIFEIGPDVEDTTVEVSTNGITWFSVGSVGGATAGIDLDAFGYGTSSSFSYVRLTDVAAEGGQSGATVGADIDAVGAISTRAAIVPEPGAWALMVLGFGGLGAMIRRRRAAFA